MKAELNPQKTQAIIQLLDRCNRNGQFSIGEAGIVHEHVVALQQGLEAAATELQLETLKKTRNAKRNNNR